MAMDGLPTSAICSIVAASALIGPMFVFLLYLFLALLLRRVSGVREPPALVLVAAGVMGGYFRRRLAWGTPNTGPEPEHFEPLSQLRQGDAAGDLARVSAAVQLGAAHWAVGVSNGFFTIS